MDIMIRRATISITPQQKKLASFSKTYSKIQTIKKSALMTKPEKSRPQSRQKDQYEDYSQLLKYFKQKEAKDTSQVVSDKRKTEPNNKSRNNSSVNISRFGAVGRNHARTKSCKQIRSRKVVMFCEDQNEIVEPLSPLLREKNASKMQQNIQNMKMTVQECQPLELQQNTEAQTYSKQADLQIRTTVQDKGKENHITKNIENSIQKLKQVQKEKRGTSRKQSQGTQPHQKPTQSLHQHPTRVRNQNQKLFLQTAQFERGNFAVTKKNHIFQRNERTLGSWDMDFQIALSQIQRSVIRS